MGWLANEPILIDCLCIKDVCSVVQNISCKSNNQLPSVASLGPNTWFLVSNRSDWLEYFAEDHILSFEGEEQNVRSELEAEKKNSKRKNKNVNNKNKNDKDYNRARNANRNKDNCNIISKFY